jgi:hypothetical protein
MFRFTFQVHDCCYRKLRRLFSAEHPADRISVSTRPVSVSSNDKSSVGDPCSGTSDPHPAMFYTINQINRFIELESYF